MSDFDLEGLNFDVAEEAVQKRNEEKENEAPLEANDGCEGGACIL